MVCIISALGVRRLLFDCIGCLLWHFSYIHFYDYAASAYTVLKTHQGICTRRILLFVVSYQVIQPSENASYDENTARYVIMHIFRMQFTGRFQTLVNRVAMVAARGSVPQPQPHGAPHD